jgi:hypothetical protein
MVSQPRIRQPLGAGAWMPEYTREIERAIVQTVSQNTATDAFLIDGGDAATDLGTSGYLVIDFGGAE